VVALLKLVNVVVVVVRDVHLPIAPDFPTLDVSVSSSEDVHPPPLLHSFRYWFASKFPVVAMVVLNVVVVVVDIDWDRVVHNDKTFRSIHLRPFLQWHYWPLFFVVVVVRWQWRHSHHEGFFVPHRPPMSLMNNYEMMDGFLFFSCQITQVLFDGSQTTTSHRTRL
jgi:hypothetical protein